MQISRIVYEDVDSTENSSLDQPKSLDTPLKWLCKKKNIFHLNIPYKNVFTAIKLFIVILIYTSGTCI